MQVVGLTGNIGSGKSTVAKAFVALGIPVFNSDDEAKKAYLIPSIQNEVREIPGSPKGPMEGLKEGPMEGSPKGPMEGPAEGIQIDFSKDTWKFEIAEIIFSNEEKRLRLETLIHAFVQNEFIRWKATQNSKYIIRESALANSFQQENCNWLIEVLAEKETRKKRVMQRSGLSENEFSKRDELQKSNDSFPPEKTFRIQNNENNFVLNEIMKIHEQLSA
jgi:dephospho-CoA kinase